MLVLVWVFFFFFSSRRRHTRYIGDWSSDVCSSDLGQGGQDARAHRRVGGLDALEQGGDDGLIGLLVLPEQPGGLDADLEVLVLEPRSEERRVGKEYRCGGTQRD